MERRSISDLHAGDRLEDNVFLVRAKDLRTTTQGGLYIHAVLVDKTGQLVARQWQATEEAYQSIPDGGFMRFKGRVESYKGNLQFIIDGMRPAEDDSFDLADFLAVTKGNREEMWTRVQDVLKKIENADLQALMQKFLDDEGLMERFRRAPAAAVMHHAYIGGLLEHTLSLLELALVTIPRYPDLSLDLVIAGLFLHDIGKADELNFETAIGYTDEGQLVGHIVLAATWIRQKADALSAERGSPFPEPIIWALQHIVLSHHGRYEFGSPKLPAIPEAVVIHYLDNLDAKVNMFATLIEKDQNASSHWTNYNHALETKIFKSDIMGTRSQA